MSDSDDDVGPAIPAGFVPPTLPDDESQVGQKRGINEDGDSNPTKKRKPKGMICVFANLNSCNVFLIL
jgi:hypothetical protein